jgi:hypothetical protein
LAGKPEGKRQFVRPRRRRKDAIKYIFLKKIGQEDVDQIQLALEMSSIKFL